VPGGGEAVAQRLAMPWCRDRDRRVAPRQRRPEIGLDDRGEVGLVLVEADDVVTTRQADASACPYTSLVRPRESRWI
jgi:hypothetical protein